MDFIESAAKALEELFAPWVIPDIMVDPLIPVPDDVRLLFKSLASNLSDDQRYLLDFGRRQFGTDKPHHWAFHNAVFDNEDALRRWIEKKIPIYNEETGEDASFEDGLQSFQNLMVRANSLGVGKSLDVARRYTKLVATLDSVDGVVDIELLVNQTYDFALACVDNQIRPDGSLSRFWFTQRGLAEPPERYEKACRLATVLYFGFQVHDKLESNIPPMYRLFRSERDEKPIRRARQLFLNCIERLFKLKDEFNPLPISKHLGTFLQYAKENCVPLPRDEKS
ncbi:hypothetical protein F5884DRAFT_758920 [Xylogone sp. PMI_703]|nr:hypothetical protein F5884DRAFT_758920 [Xylogone sp. PMI_703]